jgi:hypothetical protein
MKMVLILFVSSYAQNEFGVFVSSKSVFSAICSFGLFVVGCVLFQHQGMLLLPTLLCQARLLTVILCSDLISTIGRYKMKEKIIP